MGEKDASLGRGPLVYFTAIVILFAVAGLATAIWSRIAVGILPAFGSLAMTALAWGYFTTCKRQQEALRNERERRGIMISNLLVNIGCLSNAILASARGASIDTRRQTAAHELRRNLITLFLGELRHAWEADGAFEGHPPFENSGQDPFPWRDVAIRLRAGRQPLAPWETALVEFADTPTRWSEADQEMWRQSLGKATHGYAAGLVFP